MVVSYRRFRTTYRSNFQGSSINSGLLDTWRWDRFFVPKRL